MDPAASHSPLPPRIALVLAGGAARGAYEVGVLQHLQEEVARDLGHPLALDILCGTSVGALNVCALAAHADDPAGRVQRLHQRWTHLQVSDILQPSGSDVYSMLRSVLGRRPDLGTSDKDARRGGIFYPAGLERLLRTDVPFERIDEHLHKGRLAAVTVSTTQVASGRTVVHIQRLQRPPAAAAAHGGRALPTPRDPTTLYRDTHLTPQHALASAAIPILFPSVRIDGELHCDGGLRQNVPLSPARRLGADRLLVVNPHYIEPARPTPAAGAAAGGAGVVNRALEQAFLDPLFLLGKALNALLLDRIDNDIERLHRINDILDAGTRRYGPSFVHELNQELARKKGPDALQTLQALEASVGAATPATPAPDADGADGAGQTSGARGGVRRIQALLIRSSRDIGRLSTEFARAPAFRRRLSGAVGRLIRHLTDSDQSEADFLSYVLFDGEFARLLMETGRADARLQHQALCQLFSRAAR